MTNRSAVHTLRGYFYQFDYTILSALRLVSDDDLIEVECIEDVDIRTATDLTAVQCKYYAGTEYNHSLIKPTIMYMLSHFNEVRTGGLPRVRYRIRGYYSSGQAKLDGNIDVAFLKEHFLTYTSTTEAAKLTHRRHEELGLDDDALGEFLTLLTLEIRAQSFDAQHAEVLAVLKATFKCSPFAAEFYHYNNALAVVRGLAITATRADRTVSKATFLNRINNSNVLFHEWFVQKKGRKAHLEALRDELFSPLNVSPFERFFLVEVDPAILIRAELKQFLRVLAKKWSKVSKRDQDCFCPYVLVRGIDEAELLAVKKELRDEKFKFVDGHDFFGADFSASSIAQAPTHANGIMLKILNSIDDLAATLNAITKTREVYQFYFGTTYFDVGNMAIRHVKIQVESLGDIKAII